MVITATPDHEGSQTAAGIAQAAGALDFETLPQKHTKDCRVCSDVHWWVGRLHIWIRIFGRSLYRAIFTCTEPFGFICGSFHALVFTFD